MKRVVPVTAALVAAVAVWALSLPARRTILPSSFDDGTVRGVLHVHSRISDGRGTIDEIAEAAARAGLRFVFITDHGDGTRRPDPPSYRFGVLVIEGVEISTRGGHYVALGLPQTPYPLGGEAADVVEDVRRMGGFGIAAHPDSPKSELRWRDWSAPVDALEILNPDTSWRVHAFGGGGAAKWRLLTALLAYPVRPAEAIAHLLADDAALDAKWMALAADRPIVALAGADAHSKISLRDADPGDNSYSIPIPSYESSFESLSVHVRPEHPLAGDPMADATALLQALRAGHAYVAVDGWATPAQFQMTAVVDDAVTAQAGDSITAGKPLSLRVRSNAPGGYRVVVWNGQQPITERTDSRFETNIGNAPGIYRVTVQRPDAVGRAAWITSNPIYVRAPGSPPVHEPAPTAAAHIVRTLFDGSLTDRWSHESDAQSLAAVDVANLQAGPRVRLRYGLSGGTAVGQYAAATVATPTGSEGADAVAFNIRAEAPMRISVQVRAEVAGARPERWERSVFVDVNEKEHVIRFDRMTPVGRTHAVHPLLQDIRTILFVVDTTNTKPGASGRLWIGNPRLVQQ